MLSISCSTKFHQLPGDSVSTSRRLGCRSNTPPKMSRSIGQIRAIIEISYFAIDIAPGYEPPLAPAPPWLHNVTSRSSHAEKNGSHAGSLYGCMKIFGVGKLT